MLVREVKKDDLICRVYENRDAMGKAAAKDVAETIRDGYGSNVGVFDTVIPHSVRASEPSAEGVSIYKHCPNGKAAEAFTELTKEVLG